MMLNSTSMRMLPTREKSTTREMVIKKTFLFIHVVEKVTKFYRKTEITRREDIQM